MIEKLTLETFKEKIIDFDTQKFKNDKAIALKFSALWCKPCNSYNPIFENVSNEIKDMNFYSVDVEDEIEISEFFSIKSIPTTVIINNKGEKTSFSGMTQKNALIEKINCNL
jgi:thioredoxin 1